MADPAQPLSQLEYAKKELPLICMCITINKGVHLVASFCFDDSFARYTHEGPSGMSLLACPNEHVRL